jgi:hypothetical protein
MFQTITFFIAGRTQKQEQESVPLDKYSIKSSSPNHRLEEQTQCILGLCISKSA